jgi:outer membrane protein assembly factor BamD
MFLPIGRAVAILAAGLIFVGCASARYLVRPAPTNAEEMYEQAVDDLESGLYPEAIKGFADLKTKYPYTKYAALADLRTADTQFERAKYAEAIDAYRNFLKFHPNHEEAPYAMLQIGEAYFEQIPEDWFFLPPAAEKDQGHTKLAIAAFKDMIGRFPEAEAAEQARARLGECRSKLADHELYVANFYLGRERYKAAAGRAEGLLDTYEGLGFDEEALWIAGMSRFQTGELDRAAEHLNELKTKFPNSSWAGDASDLLTKIGNNVVTEDEETQGS